MLSGLHGLQSIVKRPAGLKGISEGITNKDAKKVYLQTPKTTILSE